MTGLNNGITMIFAQIATERSVIYDNVEDDGIILLNDKLTTIVLNQSDTLLLIAGNLYARSGNLNDFIPSDDVNFIRY